MYCERGDGDKRKTEELRDFIEILDVSMLNYFVDKVKILTICIKV